MMRKQISKKKLERLAIQGGDYRKAGRRLGQTVTLSDLEQLLADDVKNLGRMDSKTSAADSASASASASAPSNSRGSNSRATKRSRSSDDLSLDQKGLAKVPASPQVVSAGDCSWLGRDISDAELDLIMDRELLFAPAPAPAPAPTAGLRSSDESSGATEHKAGVDREDGDGECEGKESEGVGLDEEIRRDLQEFSSTATCAEEKVALEQALCAVPMEGEMYDIVSSLSSTAASDLLSLS